MKDRDKIIEESERILSENMPSPTEEGLGALHEMYLTLRGSGFSQYEGLWIVGYMLTDGSGKNFEEGENS